MKCEWCRQQTCNWFVEKMIKYMVQKKFSHILRKMVNPIQYHKGNCFDAYSQLKIALCDAVA